MKNFDRNKIIEMEINRTRIYRPILERIVQKNSHHFVRLQEATIIEDMTEGFDYCLQYNQCKIAVRIRKPECVYRDFTIRYRSEFDKIKAGMGNMYLYAWTRNNNNSESIDKYMIIDLDRLRKTSFFNDIDFDKRVKNNTDGYTKFTHVTKEELDKYGSLRTYENFNDE